jgi:hypothetical protein
MNQKVLSPFLFEKQGTRYAIANKEFGDAIIDRLGECFSREPVSAALGLSAQDLALLVARFITERTTDGRSTRDNFSRRFTNEYCSEFLGSSGS